MLRVIFGFQLKNCVNMKNLREEIKMMSVNQISVYHTLLEAYNVMRHLSSEQINKRWKLIERKYALRSTTKKQLNVPEKPKLKCLGFTYNGAKLILHIGSPFTLWQSLAQVRTFYPNPFQDTVMCFAQMYKLFTLPVYPFYFISVLNLEYKSLVATT